MGLLSVGHGNVQVMEARQRELGKLRKAVPARVGMQVLLFSTPTLAAVFAFAAYGSAAPNSFTAPHIFSAIAYFAIMRFPLVFLPFALVQVRDCCMFAKLVVLGIAVPTRTILVDFRCGELSCRQTLLWCCCQWTLGSKQAVLSLSPCSTRRGSWMRAQLGNALTAMRRLSQFLIMEERADEVEKLPSPGAIIADGNFYWAEALKTPVRAVSTRAETSDDLGTLLFVCAWVVRRLCTPDILTQDEPKSKKEKKAAKKAAAIASRQVADSASSKVAPGKAVSFADGEKVAVRLKGMDGYEEDTDEASDIAEATNSGTAVVTKVRP